MFFSAWSTSPTFFPPRLPLCSRWPSTLCCQRRISVCGFFEVVTCDIYRWSRVWIVVTAFDLRRTYVQEDGCSPFFFSLGSVRTEDIRTSADNGGFFSGYSSYRHGFRLGRKLQVSDRPCMLSTIPPLFHMPLKLFSPAADISCFVIAGRTWAWTACSATNTRKRLSSKTTTPATRSAPNVEKSSETGTYGLGSNNKIGSTSLFAYFVTIL